MNDNLPPMPESFCYKHDGTCWPDTFSAGQMKAYARAAIELQSVPAAQHVANLLDRFERQWHRMGELWERCQGKGWPEKEGAEFETLRDEKTPATRAALIAMLAAAPQPQPVQEPVYQYQYANGSWCDQTKESHDYNVRHGHATVRVLYTSPQAQPAQPLSDEQKQEIHNETGAGHALISLVESYITKGTT